MSSSKPDYKFQVLVVGSSGVGKSALLERFLKDRFNEGRPGEADSADHCIE